MTAVTELDVRVDEFVKDMQAMSIAYQTQAMEVKGTDLDGMFSWLLDMSTYFIEVLSLIPQGVIPVPEGAVVSMVRIIQNTYDNEKSFDAESAKTSAYGRALDGLADAGITVR